MIKPQASRKKFCNDISLETKHTESWRKIKNFLKPNGKCDYAASHLDAKTTKTNADKVQLFVKSVERHFGIQSDNFDLKHRDSKLIVLLQKCHLRPSHAGAGAVITFLKLVLMHPPQALKCHSRPPLTLA